MGILVGIRSAMRVKSVNALKMIRMVSGIMVNTQSILGIVIILSCIIQLFIFPVLFLPFLLSISVLTLLGWHIWYKLIERRLTISKMRIFIIPEIYFLMFCFNLATDNYFDYTLSAPLSVFFHYTWVWNMQ